MAKIIKL